MQYFKTITDEPYAYEDSVNYQDYTDKVLMPITEKEYLVISTPTSEEIAKQLQESKNNEYRAYLAYTDWHVIRELDSGVITPQAIKDKRQEAREAIKDI